MDWIWRLWDIYLGLFIGDDAADGMGWDLSHLRQYTILMYRGMRWDEVGWDDGLVWYGLDHEGGRSGCIYLKYNKWGNSLGMN